MALFASPFDIFAINHGRHVHHDPFLHRRRRRRLLHHGGNPFARHDFDSFFNILAGALDDHDNDHDHDHGVNIDKDKAKNKENKENKAARHHGDVFVFRPEVTENELGYLLTARVPGVSAADVVVAVKPGGEHGRGGDVVTVRSEKHDRVKADLRLPRGASVNAAEISASCIDGVLRVAVPKKVPSEESIVVAAPTSAAAPTSVAAAAEDDQEMKENDDDDHEERVNAPAQTIVLQVPGYSRDDITVTRKRGGAPADELIITGKSRRRRGSGSGEFTRAYRLTDPDATVTATCADGLLTISIVRPVIAPIVVPVSADNRMLPPSAVEASGAAAAAEQEGRRIITLMRHAVPGASAGDFKMEVTEGKTLRAHADYSVAGLGRRRFDFAVSLPDGVDRSTLCANVSDGLLTVTAAAPVAPEPFAVKVSGDEPAALLPPTAPPSAPTPPAAAAAAAAAAVVVHEEAGGGEK